MIPQKDIDYIRTNTDSLGYLRDVDVDDLSVYVQDLSELVLQMAEEIAEQKRDISSLEDRLWMAENVG